MRRVYEGILILSAFFSFSFISHATYTPAANIYLYGSGNSGPNGIISFSYSPSLSWSAPINPTKVDASYIFHGNVWIDSVGWTTFDHSVAGAEVKINNSTCVPDTSQSVCTLTGYLWSKNVGWIRFSGNNGVSDVEFHRPSLSLSGFAWSNQVGWIDVSGIKLILGPIFPSFSGGTDLGGGNYALSTTGSINVPLSVPGNISTLLGSLPPTTLEICILGGSYCWTYTYNSGLGRFPGVDLSLATDYSYTITDPFGSTTTGILHVYAGPIISNGSNALTGTYNAGQGLFKKYCNDNPSDLIKCPDAVPSTSFITGELKSGEVVGPRYANNQDSYIGNLKIRDAYGNPVISVAGVKDVSVTFGLTSNLDFISTPNIYQYRGVQALLGLGDAFSLDLFTNAIPIIAGGPYNYTRPYSPNGESIKIKSYAPTTVGNTTIPSNNNIKLATVVANVSNANPPYTSVGEGTYALSSLVKTTDLPFLPLAQVSTIQGFSDIQMGRVSQFTGSVVLNDVSNSIGVGSAFVIHGLTIGDGVSLTTSTFQDFTSSMGDECNAFTYAGGTSVPGYINYCERTGNMLSSPSSVITLGFSTSRDQVFEAMPRRIIEVELAQGYKYDSLIRYTIGGKEIVYPSITSESAGVTDKVFGNAVKIIGQKSGKNIFQSFVNADQATIGSVSRSDSMNAIRKNIALLTRNVTFTADTYDSANLRVYKKDITLDPQDELITDNRQTIVAYGDITLTNDLTNPNDSKALAIIALKNESGSGGNIYIQSNIKRIDAALIAQGTIFSGDKSGAPRYYPQEAGAVDTLKNQLYIYGGVSSLNTVGGASLESGSKCPDADVACNNSNALIFDFEHMRYYRGGVAEAAPLAHGSASLSSDDKKSSFIIEFNPVLLSTPPPGIRMEN